MIYALGPRAQRVYRALHERLGGLRPGAQLPTIPVLAAEFGVAPLTVRQVLATLEEEGYISREQGRGTFVRERILPGVLIVDDEPSERVLLATLVTGLGFRTLEAAGPDAGLAMLERDPAIALILSDVRMPLPETGIAFLRAARQRRPLIPLAAVTGFPDDLLPLHGTSDCPVLIIPKPVWPQYIEEVLRLTLPGRTAAAPQASGAGQRGLAAATPHGVRGHA